MRKITLLSLVAASVLFTACGEESKKAVAEATAKTTEVAKETTKDVKKVATDLAELTRVKAVELAKATKEKAAEAAKQAEVAANALTKKASEATEKVKDKVSEVTSDTGAGKAAYAKCAGCHGKDGKTKALGKSEILAGQSASDIEKKISEYKAGKRNVADMGTLMNGQVASMSNSNIKAVSAYISTL